MKCLKKLKKKAQKNDEKAKQNEAKAKEMFDKLDIDKDGS